MGKLVVGLVMLLFFLPVIAPIVTLNGINELRATNGVTLPSDGGVVIIPTPSGTVTTVSSDRIETMIANAMTWLNTPYAWSGCSRRGVDCSCFVLNVLATIGVTVPRTTVTQIAYDRPIPASEARRGDTVFFDNTCSDCGSNPTHEGLYLGNDLMIEAGSPVQITHVFAGYYGSHNPRFGRPPGL